MSNVSDGIAVFRLQDQRTNGGRGPGGGRLHRRPLSGVPVPREPADLLQEDLPGAPVSHVQADQASGRVLSAVSAEPQFPAGSR